MRHYLRALSYFKADWPLLVLLLVLIGMSTAVGLLMAWPMAILIDSVLAAPTAQDWAHRLFLGFLPSSHVGQIIGLGLCGLALKFGQDLLSMLQSVLSNHVNYNGLMRVRCDLYRKLQSLNLAYHKSRPQGDVIYRLSSDTAIRGTRSLSAYPAVDLPGRPRVYPIIGVPLARISVVEIAWR
jgi:subfamily B ATP-binding cassette protein MsbA